MNTTSACQVMTLIVLLAFGAAGEAAGDGLKGSNETEADAAMTTDALNLLFIHHSCGGQLLAGEGLQSGGEADSGRRCIYESHPNGGGLRGLIEAEGIVVGEASYGSTIGGETDIRHWSIKFRDHMDDILRARMQDKTLPEGERNDVVVFKSCFPNNDFIGPGAGPGEAASSQLTVVNAKAAYGSLLPEFRKHPDVLFVAFTAPPMAEPVPRGPKAKIKRLFKGAPKAGRWARQFNTWLADRQDGWLGEYDLPNVVVFDYYDILTGDGAGDWSAYPTREGRDSHPSSAGNRRAAEAFVPLLRESLAALAAD